MHPAPLPVPVRYLLIRNPPEEPETTHQEVQQSAADNPQSVANSSNSAAMYLPDNAREPGPRRFTPQEAANSIFRTEEPAADQGSQHLPGHLTLTLNEPSPPVPPVKDYARAHDTFLSPHDASWSTADVQGKGKAVAHAHGSAAWFSGKAPSSGIEETQGEAAFYSALQRSSPHTAAPYPVPDAARASSSLLDIVFKNNSAPSPDASLASGTVANPSHTDGLNRKERIKIWMKTSTETLPPSPDTRRCTIRDHLLRLNFEYPTILGMDDLGVSGDQTVESAPSSRQTHALRQWALTFLSDELKLRSEQVDAKVPILLASLVDMFYECNVLLLQRLCSGAMENAKTRKGSQLEYEDFTFDLDVKYAIRAPLDVDVKAHLAQTGKKHLTLAVQCLMQAYLVQDLDERSSALSIRLPAPRVRTQSASKKKKAQGRGDKKPERKEAACQTMPIESCCPSCGQAVKGKSTIAGVPPSVLEDIENTLPAPANGDRDQRGLAVRLAAAPRAPQNPPLFVHGQSCTDPAYLFDEDNGGGPSRGRPWNGTMPADGGQPSGGAIEGHSRDIANATDDAEPSGAVTAAEQAVSQSVDVGRENVDGMKVSTSKPSSRSAIPSPALRIRVSDEGPSSAAFASQHVVAKDADEDESNDAASTDGHGQSLASASAIEQAVSSSLDARPEDRGSGGKASIAKARRQAAARTSSVDVGIRKSERLRAIAPARAPEGQPGGERSAQERSHDPAATDGHASQSDSVEEQAVVEADSEASAEVTGSGGGKNVARATVARRSGRRTRGIRARDGQGL
ncbi:uncharacterized protein LAESUDRAFT_764707 [Laetiporus sulphureus 93-53]|uniref:Uncharacterized protein n=1 Tax=Laetiporus sulphureus 93-53 TaxID=1314785 RepID=A0A165B6H9_9APHY|nr:uncharacterized protein LAESUDRAFT_764707 [Laetiporus sulphureus 93-53]KZT00353.1 hypothetical protein LAESUDRAFT_764707 [Laetiporus sulphureus 93-53]